MRKITIYDLLEKPNEKIERVYANSSITLYEDNGVYFVADNPNSKPWELGNADAVIEFLAQFIEEE